MTFGDLKSKPFPVMVGMQSYVKIIQKIGRKIVGTKRLPWTKFLGHERLDLRRFIKGFDYIQNGFSPFSKYLLFGWDIGVNVSSGHSPTSSHAVFFS